MKVSMGKHRLLSAVLFISLGAIPVVTTLAGCGATSKGPLPASLATRPGTGFAGRSFSSVVALSGSQRGVVNLSVNAAGRVTGTLALQNPARIVPLTGNVNMTTGVFSASGTDTGTGQSTPVSVSGTLPSSGLGGNVTLTLQGQQFNGTFTVSSTGGSPTPGSTPTPTPTGTGTPTPTPTPTPTGGPTLNASYFVRRAANDILTYRQTTTQTTTIGGQTTTNTQTITTNNDPGAFAQGREGVSTQVNLNGVTVTRQETLDTSNRVTGFIYFTQDANAYTFYGFDQIEPPGSGTVTSTTRVSPALRFPFNLAPGQTLNQTVTFTVTETGQAPVSYTYTYGLTFFGLETVVVPAGTFANAAKVKTDFSFTEPGDGVTPATTVTTSLTNFIAPNVGTVKSDGTTQISAGSDFSSNSTINTVLQSATINGVNFP